MYTLMSRKCLNVCGFVLVLAREPSSGVAKPWRGKHTCGNGIVVVSDLEDIYAEIIFNERSKSTDNLR